jgi:hypothetical protein
MSSSKKPGSFLRTCSSAKTWGRFLLWIFTGLAYIVAAAFALAPSLVAAPSLFWRPSPE